MSARVVRHKISGSPAGRRWWPLAAAGLLVVPLGAVAWQTSGGEFNNLNSPQPPSGRNSNALNVNSASSKSQMDEPDPAGSSSSSSAGSKSVNQRVFVNQSVTSDGDNQTEVKINGQQVKVPTSGELHKTVVSPDGGRATIDITSNESKGSGGSTSSSVNLQVKSSSSSSSSTGHN